MFGAAIMDLRSNSGRSGEASDSRTDGTLRYSISATITHKNTTHLHNLQTYLPADLPSAKGVHQLLGTGPPAKYVLATDADDIRHSFAQLRSLDFTADDIRAHPKVLAKNALTIHNHYHVLAECGFTSIGIPSINRYTKISNLSVDNLKRMHFIEPDVDVTGRLADRMQVPLDAGFSFDTEADSLKLLRRAVLNVYLGATFGWRSAECDRIWSTYSNLRNKSFGSVCDAVAVCEQLVGMDRERIKQHPYVLYADPENVRQIVALGTLGGIDTRQLIWRRPKIMMTNVRNLLKVQQVIREFGVPDAAFPRCVEIFTLGPRTIYERLCDLRKIKEFDVLVNHPRVLRLVHYQMKARARLEYLRKLKVNCVSLHVLSSGATSFERYARTGVDRTKGVDILQLLHQRFGRTIVEIRAMMNRHPNWCHVPVVAVKDALDWLSGAGYTDDVIYSNVHILLYPL